MRASRNKKPDFEPITLTIETQGELIALFCVLNHADIQEIFPALDDAQDCLAPYCPTELYANEFDKLSRQMKFKKVQPPCSTRS